MKRQRHTAGLRKEATNPTPRRLEVDIEAEDAVYELLSWDLPGMKKKPRHLA